MVSLWEGALMSLLSDDIKNLFGDVFGEIYDPGTITRKVLTNVGGGKMTSVETSRPCLVQVDACTEAMRLEAGYTNNDVRLLVLQKGHTVEITTDDYVTARGNVYKVGSVSQDPAESYWECRGMQKQ